MKQIKKFLSLLLAAVLVLSQLPAQAIAAEAAMEQAPEPAEPMGVTADGIKYTVYEDHVEITGHTGYPGELTIPAKLEGLPVTAIGSYAFHGSSLTRVTIPDGVQVIGPNAFSECKKLTGVSIPESVVSIGKEAFAWCWELDAVTIPESVTEIGASAFLACSDLTSVAIPKRITRIEESTFSGCESLVSVTTPESVTVIGPYAFRDCVELPGISIPESVARIEEYAFCGCESLRQVVLPEGITGISDGTFSGCDNLTCLTIPEGVTSIGASAFYSSGLTEMTIPGRVASIGENAFGWCLDMERVTIREGVGSIGENAFYMCCGLTSVSIPGSVATVGDSAFSHCEGLTSVTVGKGAVSIGAYAFESCTNLTDVTLSEGTISIGDCAFYRCGLTEVTIPKSVSGIGTAPFLECENLTGIRVHKDNPAYCSDSRGVLYSKDMSRLIQAPSGISGSYTIPERTAVIGDLAFCGCSGLTHVTIPAGVTGIGAEVFLECTSLAGLAVDRKNPSYSSDSHGVLFDKAKTRLIQAPGAFQGSYTVPDSVTAIDASAFAYCTGLKHITMPDGITSIGEEAFVNCDGLTELTIPLGVTEIREETFNSCKYLTSVTIQGGVKSIGRYAFAHCFYLSEIRFCGDAPQIDSAAFYSVRIGTAYYPAGNPTWTEDVMKGYYGNLKWVSYEHIHDYHPIVTAPTCTEQGYTTYSCTCGGYVDDYVDALGHQYANACCTRCGEPDPDYPDSPFLDVPRGAFYYVPVLWAVEQEITSGMTPDTFGPFSYCNRAQVVTFLWRAAGSPEPKEARNPFADVPENTWYTGAVLWAVENGITNGLTADTFGPNIICNRAQVVTFLWRAYGCDEPALSDNPFVDVPAGSFYEKAVRWAFENNVTTGSDARHFDPLGQCMRAHVVTFLYRADRCFRSCTVTFDSSGGIGPAAVEVRAGDTISSPEDPEREGYVFTGWFADRTLDSLFLFDHSVIKSDITLYAGWIPEGEDAWLVRYGADRLAIGYRQGDYAGHVTADVILPDRVDGAEGVTVSWRSDSDAVSPEGRVTRPEREDAYAILTAQVSRNGAAIEVPFVLRVIHLDDRAADEVEELSISDIQERNEGNDHFDLDANELSQVTSISGAFSDIVIENADDALDVAQSIHALVGLRDPYGELALQRIHDSEYKTSYTFAQMYNGRPVYSLGMTVSADPEGEAYGMSAGVCKTSLLDLAPAEPRVTAREAEEAAQHHWIGTVEADPERTELVYYALNEYEYKPALVYLVYVSGTDETGTYLNRAVFVDSQTGAVLHSEQLSFTAATGSGENEQGDRMTFPVEKKSIFDYVMEDSKRGFTVYTCTSNGTAVEKNAVESVDNTWNDPTAVSAYTNVIKTYDWYRSVLGRTGLRNDSSNTNIYVHEPSKRNNSFWDPVMETLNFCDNFSPTKRISTAGALDIVAHEYTHGVYCFEVGVLPHSNTTGAINEGYADIMGNFVDGDWHHGEDWIFGRDASAPDSEGPVYKGPDKVSHAYYVHPLPSSQLNESNDFGGIHTNSLLLSHAAYLMCEEFGDYSLSPYTAAYLWYLSMSEGYTGRSTYRTVRQNVLKAAEAMELSEKKIETIKAAFDRVEIWASSGRVQVRLRDQNGDPLQLAVLRIWRGEDEWTFTDTASFELELLPGNYSFELTHPNYSDYTGTVTIEKDRTSQLTLTVVGEGEVTVYPSHVSFVTKDVVELCRAPSELDKREVVKIVSDGLELTSTALYELSLDHHWVRGGDVSHTTEEKRKSLFWYEVEYDGNTCYIYGGDTTAHRTDQQDISISNVEAPSELEEHSDFSIGGLIATSHTEISSVSVLVTSDDGGTSIRSGDPFRGNVYELRDSIIDCDLDFGLLEAGSYTYRIVADTVNYFTTDGQDIRIERQSRELFRTKFTVGVVSQTYSLDLRGEGWGVVMIYGEAEAAKGERLYFYAIPGTGCELEGFRVETQDPDYDAVENGLEIVEIDEDFYELVMVDHDLIVTCVFVPSELSDDEVVPGAIASGRCGPKLIWWLTEDGVLTISGVGAMWPHEMGDLPWYDYREQILSVRIEDGVTNIGDYAFDNCVNMTSADISDGVTAIGYMAFSDCEKLETIHFPERLNYIGFGAFWGCSSLTAIDLPDSVTFIGNQAFLSCTGLISVDLPDALTSIGNWVFGGCKSLTAVRFPDGLTSIGGAAFYGCESLAEIDLPDCIVSIGDQAFDYCKSLTEVHIPEGLVELGDGVFCDCIKLTKVNIPQSITSINDWMFCGCTRMTEYDIPDWVTSIGECAFFRGGLTRIDIPEGITSIGSRAFEDSYKLREIVFYGDAPYLAEDVFTDVTATAYYPSGNPTWTADVMQDYGGAITWKAR